MTMLSGPAASVAGALMHLRVSDGLYFEVGGTSTNIGVIRNGRPTVTYARVGGHETYVSSLDVRVIGIAGGSLVRATPGPSIDVGPRSAHIAGLPYAAFADEGEIVDPRIELFEPKPGDGDDYVAVRVASGARYALTVDVRGQCARLHQARHARARQSSGGAARIRGARATHLGMSVEETARAVLDAASDKLVPVVQGLDRGIRARRRPAAADRRGRRRGVADPLHLRAPRPQVRDLQGCRGHLVDRRGAGPGARRGRARHPASAAGGPAGHPPRGAGGGGAGRRRRQERRGDGRDRSADPSRARHRRGSGRNARQGSRRLDHRGRGARDCGQLDGGSRRDADACGGDVGHAHLSCRRRAARRGARSRPQRCDPGAAQPGAGVPLHAAKGRPGHREPLAGGIAA